MSVNQIMWLLLAAIAVTGALGVVLSKSAVRSALFLVLNFFTLAFLYFTLGAQFLGIVQILVYAGAIMVLFLFVVMLLKDKKQLDEAPARDLKVPVAAALAFGMAAIIVSQVVVGSLSGDYPAVSSEFGRPQSIGFSLFTTYVWPFEMISVLLLIGIVGSILLVKRRNL